MAISKTPNKTEIQKTYSQLVDAGYELIQLHQAFTVSQSGKRLGKAPIGSKWTTRDPLILDEASSLRLQGYNIGNRLTAETVVIDIDPKNAPDGVELLEALVAEFPSLEPLLAKAPCVLTGSRSITDEPGRHYYFHVTLPEGEGRIRDGLPHLAGIEFKSLGRQVVAPLSQHPDTELLYEWDKKPKFPAPKLPAGVLEKIWLPKGGRTTLTDGEAVLLPEQLEEVLSRLDVLQFDSNETWEPMMFACHDATGGAGFDEFVAWSTSDPCFADRAHEIQSRWDSLDASKTGNVTWKTLEKICRDHGVEGNLFGVEAGEFAGTEDTPPDLGVIPYQTGLDLDSVRADTNKNGDEQDSFPTALNLVTQLQTHIMIGRNLLTGLVEFRKQQDWMIGQQLNDVNLKLLRTHILLLFKADISEGNLASALDVVASLNRFHPVVEYLDGLEWDGEARIERMLADLFGISDSEYSRAVSQLMMVAAASRARRPGCKFDCMVILEGKQGVGKSSGLRALCKDPNWFSDAALQIGPNTDAKSVISLEGTWIYEMAELEALARSQLRTEQLKAFITRQEDTFRRPYDRFPTTSPRNFIMIGTTNESGYLTDLSGNRRYLPVQVVNEIQVAEVARLRDQLWAEADQLAKEQEALHLPSDLWEVAAAEQEQRLIGDPWADTLLPVLEGQEHEPIIHGEEKELVEKIHARDCLALLGINGGKTDVHHGRRLRKVMEALGFEYKPKGVRIRKKSLPGYVRVQ